MSRRPVVRSARSAERPFAPIVVTGLGFGLAERDALRAAKRAVKSTRRFRRFDFRAFTYEPRAGRATFI